MFADDNVRRFTVLRDSDEWVSTLEVSAISERARLRGPHTRSLGIRDDQFPISIPTWLYKWSIIRACKEGTDSKNLTSDPSIICEHLC
jgi:hypothetical protein